MYMWPLTSVLCSAPKPLSLHGPLEQGGPGKRHQPDRASYFLASLLPLDEKPECFAEAGKMEPNQLLDGFGPLQPAVAVH